MLTIERLAKIDNIVTRIIAGLRRGVEYLSDHYETRLVDAAYRVAEAKAAVIGKTEDKISDLEDARAALVMQGAADELLLREKYRAAHAALDAKLTVKGDKLAADLAAAAEALVAADKDYEATIQEANEKLGVGIEYER